MDALYVVHSDCGVCDAVSGEVQNCQKEKMEIDDDSSSASSVSSSQKEQFITVNHLHDLLQKEDSDSDDSDYQMSDVSDEPFSLDDYEVEFVEPLRPHVPSPHEISVLELCQQLSSHSKNLTVGTFLTKVITEEDSDYIGVVKYTSEIGRELPEAPSGDGPTTLGEYWIRSKAYGTPLHHACQDPDGKRGEEKIRIILSAAQTAEVEMALLLSVREVHFNIGHPHRLENMLGNNRKLERDKEDTDASTTPLFLLISNNNSTVDAARLLCQAWPRVVSLRTSCNDTILHALMIDSPRETDPDGRKRHIGLVRLVLGTAQKNLGGARALLETTEERLTGTDNAEDEDLNRDSYDFDDGGYDPYTALHYLCSYDPPDMDLFIPLFMKYWPDALLYCEELGMNGGSYPFHDAITSRGALDFQISAARQPNRLAMQNLCSFLEHSSLRGLARAFLNADTRRPAAGFVLARDTLEYSKEDDPNVADNNLKERAKTLIGTALAKRDTEGLGLLHHIAAHPITPSEKEKRKETREAKYERYRATTWEHNYDLDPTPEDKRRSRERILVLEDRNKKHINEAIQWLSSFSCSKKTKIYLDRDGRNPLHYALSVGKTWDKGIHSLVRIDSDWPTAKDAQRLYPFMTAALAESNQDLTTVFELLRHAPQLVS